MALQLASPGINVREVDLTRGGVNASLNVAAGLAGPFQKGPVNEIIRITTSGTSRGAGWRTFPSVAWCEESGCPKAPRTTQAHVPALRIDPPWASAVSPLPEGDRGPEGCS